MESWDINGERRVRDRFEEFFWEVVANGDGVGVAEVQNTLLYYILLLLIEAALGYEISQMLSFDSSLEWCEHSFTSHSSSASAQPS